MTTRRPHRATGKPVGRPAADDPRRNVTSVRLTDAEHAEAIELAAASGLKISDGLRTYGIKAWRSAVRKAAREADRS